MPRAGETVIIEQAWIQLGLGRKDNPKREGKLQSQSVKRESVCHVSVRSRECLAVAALA
jgi:hypothetical protein